ncbi:MAG: M20/M25/M40 family metallo-hydrolase [Acidimicrobiia bacterium]|nr:M20/M25/M40 family metallo-hydrolase [Acidimicrobiia bacterium]
MTRLALFALLACLAFAQQPDWPAVEEEALRHFQALLRFDTSDPPGNEAPAVDYLKQVLEREGIPVKIFALEKHRPNLVARLKGSGKKRPLLIMGHTDVVNVDPAKWRFPPFSATRDGGYVYARGTVDDKDNLTACLMIMLLLKRLNVPLDRDVIFLAEAGEEGTVRVGIKFMVENYFSEIDAEYCLAEGGGVTRRGGKVSHASVGTTEKIPYAVRLVARGPAGHGSVPLRTNAVVHLSQAVAKVAAWQTPMRLNDTTRAYFERLATLSSPEDAARYNSIVDPAKAPAIQEYFAEHEPRHHSMLRTSISPNIIRAGYRVNVIPSEAEATLDIRAFPTENMDELLAEMKKVINDPAVEIVRTQRDTRPAAAPSAIKNEAFLTIEQMVRKHYGVITLPTMQTGATDMAYLRAKGIQSYGIGPATDAEDGPKGFGAHSDQERILEAEFQRFVRYHYDIVAAIARAQ